jgi:hypothetical protein
VTDSYRIGRDRDIDCCERDEFGHVVAPWAEEYTIVKGLKSKQVVTSFEQFQTAVPKADLKQVKQIERLFRTYPKLYLTLYPGA